MATKQIEEFTFELQPLTTWKGLRAFHRFAALMGPALGGLVALATQKKSGGDNDKLLAIGLLVKTLPDALQKSTPEQVEELAREVLAGALVKTPNGKLGPLEPTIDTLLQGRLFTFLSLIVWACEVHFGGFFAELLRAVPGGSTSPERATTPST